MASQMSQRQLPSLLQRRVAQYFHCGTSALVEWDLEAWGRGWNTPAQRRETSQPTAVTLSIALQMNDEQIFKE